MLTECIGVLLHQHDQSVQNEEDRVCPWPFSKQGPAKDCKYIK